MTNTQLSNEYGMKLGETWAVYHDGTDYESVVTGKVTYLKDGKSPSGATWSEVMLGDSYYLELDEDMSIGLVAAVREEPPPGSVYEVHSEYGVSTWTTSFEGHTPIATHYPVSFENVTEGRIKYLRKGYHVG